MYYTPAVRLLDLVLPQTCVVCGVPTGGRLPVCAGCKARLEPIVGRRCAVCGVPLIAEKTTCVRCRDRRTYYRRHRSIFAFEGTARRVIAAYKFGGRFSLAELLGNCLARWLRETYPRELPLVVPAPASPAGRRRRGFDQSLRLARILERRYGVPVCRALRRTGRRQQKQLDYEARSRNLRGAISLARRRLPTLPKTILVLDDVFTTGATVNECARVLREAGIETVDAVTLAAD